VPAKSGEKGYALGLKPGQVVDEVWVTYNAQGAAALRRYDLETGKLLKAASIQGKHVFNDLAIAPAGAIYVTDTAEGSVYQLFPGTTAFKRIAPEHPFTAANGIAISDDGKLLYVSTWEDGIDVIKLGSGEVAPMTHPEDVCLAFIDGLYATHGSLVAIQNGPMLPRVVEFRLDQSHSRITTLKILERRNSAFDGITTGVIVDDELYYVANPQTDQQNDTRLRPLQIFSVLIAPR